METPDVIDLRKAQRKEPEKALYQVKLMLRMVWHLANVPHYTT